MYGTCGPGFGNVSVFVTLLLVDSSSDNEIKKENLSTILDSLGSDEKTEMLPSPSCKHIFVPKKDTFTFFEYLDTASIKLLHKENFFLHFLFFYYI
jgi:hypothetical protein